MNFKKCPKCNERLTSAHVKGKKNDDKILTDVHIEYCPRCRYIIDETVTLKQPNQVFTIRKQNFKKNKKPKNQSK